MLQFLVHYSLHFIAPGIIAYVFFRAFWIRAWLIMIATMLIDLDHLLATPIFDPNRCSINFHPLHTYWALGIYIALLFFKKTRVVGIGLTLHFITDFIDCLWG
ncbi:hypothetical protein EI546_01215 [Aequorivita sp. H23M31]|uniref:Metal-dependent hydrolase n=1 Tax=Aequorivita ciconiae TaxID=2494375 RepID=A0A410FZL7_9FLAO|nr:DUF6122 family protein [Aequorivita sp. H23M31]QAA80431.1 hypothetical protein EI546_01215 [Aequorivita sp. H23M31]